MPVACKWRVRTRGGEAIVPPGRRGDLAPTENTCTDSLCYANPTFLDPAGEGGWDHFEDVEWSNVASRDLEELREQFHLAVARLRRMPRLVRDSFAQAGLPLAKTCAQVGLPLAKT